MLFKLKNSTTTYQKMRTALSIYMLFKILEYDVDDIVAK